MTMTQTTQEETKTTSFEKKKPLSCQSTNSKVEEDEDCMVVIDLEKGEVDDTTTASTDQSTDKPIVIAIPLGYAACDDRMSSAKKSKQKRITKPKQASPFRFDESSPVFKTTLAVVCSGTILLGCAVVGTLVAKGVHHYQILDFQEDWS